MRSTTRAGRVVHQRSDSNGKAAFVAFLDHLAQTLSAKEPIVFMLDYIGYHESHELRAWWQQHADRFQPFWLAA